MRKQTLKRLVLGLVQQTAALLLLVAIATVLFNSYLAVDTADGTKVYELSPLDAETEFEDSVIFMIFSECGIGHPAAYGDQGGNRDQ